MQGAGLLRLIQLAVLHTCKLEFKSAKQSYKELSHICSGTIMNTKYFSIHYFLMHIMQVVSILYKILNIVPCCTYCTSTSDILKCLLCRRFFLKASGFRFLISNRFTYHFEHCKTPVRMYSTS